MEIKLCITTTESYSGRANLNHLITMALEELNLHKLNVPVTPFEYDSNSGQEHATLQLLVEDQGSYVQADPVLQQVT